MDSVSTLDSDSDSDSDSGLGLGSDLDLDLGSGLAAEKKVPVIVFSGFLGSGKTTIINNLLADAAGARIGVLVNDFGSVNVDGKLVAGQIGEPVELASGCICCMMDGNALDEPLGKLMKLGPDAILIEASGLAEPRELAHKILSSRVSRAEYGGIIYVVDCLNFDAIFEKFGSQIGVSLRAADLVIFNKYDGGGLPVELKYDGASIRTADGRVETRLVFDFPDSPRPRTASASPVGTRKSRFSLGLPPSEASLRGESGKSHDHRHIHHDFSSASIETEKPLDPVRFVEFVNTLPAEIYRAKGVIYFGMKGLEQKYVFQKVGGFKDIQRVGWKAGEKPATRFAIIGTGFDEEEMEERLRDLIDENPDDLTAENTIKL